MAKTISNLAVSFTAKTSKFTKGVNRMKRDLKKIKRQVAKMAKISIGITIAGAAAAIATINRIAGSIDDLSKTAEKLGIPINKLKGLQHAAKLSGVPVTTLNMALQRMTRRLSEAAQGTGEAQSALEELRLDAAMLAKLSPDEQFMAIADAMENVGTQSDRVRLAFKIFDSEGVSLVNTMKGGSVAIRAAQEDMIALGGTLDEEGVSKVVKMQDQVTRLKTLFSNVAQQVMMLAAGPLANLIQKFIDAKIEGGGIGKFVSEGIEMAINSIAAMVNAIEWLKAGWQSFRSIVLTVGRIVTETISGWIVIIRKLLDLIGIETQFGGAFLAVNEAMRKAQMEAANAAGTSLTRATEGAAGKEVVEALNNMTSSIQQNSTAAEANTAMFKEMLKGGNMQNNRSYVRGFIIPELQAAGR